MMEFVKIFFVFESMEVAFDDFSHSNVDVRFGGTFGMRFDGEVKKCDKHFI